MTDLLPCPFCGGPPELIIGGPGNWFVRCQVCRASGDDTMRDHAAQLWNARTSAQAPMALPDRERMAEIVYTAVHKGLQNCWQWSDGALDREHPTIRAYWYKIADGTLSALSSTDGKSPQSFCGESGCTFQDGWCKCGMEG